MYESVDRSYIMNLITAASDCNARPCQKLSHIVRVELVLKAKVCETHSFSLETEFTSECRDREGCYGIDVGGFFSVLFPFPLLSPVLQECRVISGYLEGR